MSWAEALLIVMTYCMSGSNQRSPIKVQNQCRTEKMACVKRVTRGEPDLKVAADKIDREISLVNGCLDDSNFKPEPVAQNLIKTPTDQPVVQPSPKVK